MQQDNIVTDASCWHFVHTVNQTACAQELLHDSIAVNLAPASHAATMLVQQLHVSTTASEESCVTLACSVSPRQHPQQG